MQGAIKELQETAIVMAGIQARQAELVKGHSDWLVEHDRTMARVESNLAEATGKMNDIESNLTETTGKLNALISIVDDMVRYRKNGNT